jgi:hypothetical protein
MPAGPVNHASVLDDDVEHGRTSSAHHRQSAGPGSHRTEQPIGDRPGPLTTWATSSLTTSRTN